MGYRRNRAADIVAVLQHRVAGIDRVQSDLVAERNGIERLQRYGLVGFHDPACQLLAGLRIFDHHHPDGVGFVVNNKVRWHAL